MNFFIFDDPTSHTKPTTKEKNLKKNFAMLLWSWKWWTNVFILLTFQKNHYDKNMGFASAITLSKLAEIKIKVKCSAVTSPLLLSCREKPLSCKKFLQFCAWKYSCISYLNALSQFLPILKHRKLNILYLIRKQQ